MARDFDGSTQYGRKATFASITAYPFSMHCRANFDTVAGGKALFTLYKDTSNFFTIMTDGGSSTIRAREDGSGSGASADSAASPTGGTWLSALAVFAANNSRTIYVNGGSKVTNTNTLTTTFPTDIFVGSLDTTNFLVDAKIAECAIWNVALTDAEALSLAAGIAPDRIRPASLVEYFELMGKTSPEPGRRGNTLTLTNSPTAADHPKVFRGRRRVTHFIPAAAAPAGGVSRIVGRVCVGPGIVGRGIVA